MHPALLATALGDGGDAGVFLQFIGALEAFAILSESDEQSWRQMRACTRQSLKKNVVQQRRCELGNRPIKPVNRLQGDTQLFDQDQRMQPTWHDDTRVIGKWYSGLDGIEASANDLGPAAVVGVEERLEAGLASALDLSQRWPAGQEVAKEDRVRILEPVEGLRIVMIRGIDRKSG